MTDMQILFRMIDVLDVEEKEQLIEYLQNHLYTVSPDAESNERIPDLFPGIWMSDDFTDELPDEFRGFDKAFDV